MRRSADPDAIGLDFLRSTHEAAADGAGWDRSTLETDPGRLPQLAPRET
ncbi:hypothetical protein I6N91_04480 [Arthrobacter sp. MSA 4-2]|nr:hypothetical protein [Arthrobacter sp. MSA 4-2]